MKIYIVDGHVLEDDYTHTSGIFIDLQFAQTVDPSEGIDLMIIKEMLLLDSQFCSTQLSYVRELSKDSGEWSEWV